MINHCHARGMTARSKEWPLVKLEYWDQEELMTGISGGHPVRVIGAAVLRVEMTELGKRTGPVILVRAKIFAKG
eukprot:408409-Lingulodinium_polyedra.AAC.1